MQHLHGSIPSDPGLDSRGVRHQWNKITTSGGVTQQPNGTHVSYPAFDQVGMLAKAFDPAVRGAWLKSEHPQMMANEAYAAANGMQIWPKHDGHVFPTENIVTYIGGNNVDDGKGGHDWEEQNGYAVVDAHHQAVAHHLNAAAYHQQAAAHFQHHTY